MIDVRALSYEERRMLRGALARELAFQGDRRALASSTHEQVAAFDRSVLIGEWLQRLTER